MPLVQAGIPSASCIHGALDTAGHSHALTHVQTSTDDAPKAPAHERCCCDVVGHCSSTAVDTESLWPGAHVYRPAYRPRLTIDAAARGFFVTPYRPPSPAV